MVVVGVVVSTSLLESESSIVVIKVFTWVEVKIVEATGVVSIDEIVVSTSIFVVGTDSIERNLVVLLDRSVFIFSLIVIKSFVSVTVELENSVVTSFLSVVPSVALNDSTFLFATVVSVSTFVVATDSVENSWDVSVKDTDSVFTILLDIVLAVFKSISSVVCNSVMKELDNLGVTSVSVMVVAVTVADFISEFVLVVSEFVNVVLIIDETDDIISWFSAAVFSIEAVDVPISAFNIDIDSVEGNWEVLVEMSDPVFTIVLDIVELDNSVVSCMISSETVSDSISVVITVVSEFIKVVLKFTGVEIDDSVE